MGQEKQTIRSTMNIYDPKLMSRLSQIDIQSGTTSWHTCTQFFITGINVNGIKYFDFADHEHNIKIMDKIFNLLCYDFEYAVRD